MKRSRRVLLVSHCILNQNVVIPEAARALGAIPSVVSWAEENGYGFVQLPCPEFTFLGLNRPPMTYEEYDTPEYRAHCRHILEPVVGESVEYQRAGYEIGGAVGIGKSPSCDPGRGVFMEELQRLFRERGIDVEDWWYLPAVEEPTFDPEVHRIGPNGLEEEEHAE